MTRRARLTVTAVSLTLVATAIGLFARDWYLQKVLRDEAETRKEVDRQHRENARRHAEETAAIRSPQTAQTAAATPEPKTFAEAVAMYRPTMADMKDETSDGAVSLARWGAENFTWSDLAVAKNETSFGQVLKDSDAERGKRMCVSGQIVQIFKSKTKMKDIAYTGIIAAGAVDPIYFAAVKSTGSLVAKQPARLCGVVTGKYDYTETGGGVAHAIYLVGVFDLPENRGASGPAKGTAASQRQESVVEVGQKKDGARPLEGVTAP